MGDSPPVGKHIDALPQQSAEASCYPAALIGKYLRENSRTFQQLCEIRRKGWENPAGDAHFERQRRQADKCNDKTAKFFYQMMQRIGYELERCTGCFSIVRNHEPPHTILDMCAAPGGILKTALEMNPGARAQGFSLPLSNGGHRLLLPEDPCVEMRWADITMFAGDMGITEVPPEHPDFENFLPRQIPEGGRFDLILCDGQVLRTHERASYREPREAHRLTATQVSLALEHVRPGGTMVVLLHKVEAWWSVFLLYNFHKFSTIKLFKSATSHATRSSFYLVATDIRSESQEVSSTIQFYKRLWQLATFGTDDEYRAFLYDDEATVQEVLQHFGSTLVELGNDIWKIQERALRRASFNQATS